MKLLNFIATLVALFLFAIQVTASPLVATAAAPCNNGDIRCWAGGAGVAICADGWWQNKETCQYSRTCSDIDGAYPMCIRVNPPCGPDGSVTCINNYRAVGDCWDQDWWVKQQCSDDETCTDYGYGAERISTCGPKQ